MKEWIIQNFDGSVITAICTFVVGLASAITSLVVNLKSSKRLSQLEKAKENGSYAVCPKCHKKIAINDIEFHLANGALDNNLNGIDDDQE